MSRKWKFAMTKIFSRLCVATTALLVVWSGQATARGDIDDGRREFNRSCQQCHSLKRGEVIQGPSLAGVFGRRAGSLEEFNYSNAMKESKIIWTQESLNDYLASPLTAMGSGIDMMTHGVRDDDDRADLIEFLKHSL